MLIGSSKFAFAVFSFFIFISFPLLLWLFVPVYDVISEIVIDACFRHGDLSMHWHQPHIGKERQRERKTRLAANQYRVYSQVYSKSVYLLLNYLPKLQFVAFISISFNLIWTFTCWHVAMKPFWHYDVAIKVADFPPCCIFTAATRVASLFFVISLLLCQICQAFWWGESLANSQCGKYFIRLGECRSC